MVTRWQGGIVISYLKTEARVGGVKMGSVNIPETALDK
jgi:hypothetical protein